MVKDGEFTQKNYDVFRKNLKEMIKINPLRKKVPLIKRTLVKIDKIGEKIDRCKDYRVTQPSRYYSKTSGRCQEEFLMSHKSFNRNNVPYESMKLDKHCKMIEQILNFFVNDQKSNVFTEIMEDRESYLSEESNWWQKWCYFINFHYNMSLSLLLSHILIVINQWWGRWLSSGPPFKRYNELSAKCRQSSKLHFKLRGGEPNGVYNMPSRKNIEDLSSCKLPRTLRYWFAIFGSRAVALEGFQFFARQRAKHHLWLFRAELCSQSWATHQWKDTKM